MLDPKFLATIEPGSTLALHFTPQARGLGFEVRRDSTLVARGTLGSPGR